MRCTRLLLLTLFAGFVWGSEPALAAEPREEPTAATHTVIPVQPGTVVDARVPLYFFRTSSCPHCQAAQPFVAAMAAKHPWLEVHDHEIYANPDSVDLFIRLAGELNQSATSVPAFIFCKQMITGFDTAANMGASIEQALIECHQARVAAASNPGGDNHRVSTPLSAPVRSPAIPMLGDVDLERWSLPLVAIVLGALDSFNPCAFFVLLFLLSLLVNARSRVRMMLIGGLFVTISGLAYFAFMAAWLNVFLLFGQLIWVTAAAGLLALTIGAINVKDYFWLGRGPSLSVSAGAKPKLFRRMRGLVNADSLVVMIAGTTALALIANIYELLCTAGFPMVFTRLLTLEERSATSHYAYLALYCVVYVLPLLAIVGGFAVTLGRRKLTEREGRLLKLLSGLMMVGLGTLLLVNPAWLSSIVMTASLIVFALAGTWALSRFNIADRQATPSGD